MVNKEPILRWQVLFLGLLPSYKQLLGISEILSACQFSPLIWKQSLENAGVCMRMWSGLKWSPNPRFAKHLLAAHLFSIAQHQCCTQPRGSGFQFPQWCQYELFIFFHSDKLISISKHCNTVKQLRAAIVTKPLQSSLYTLHKEPQGVSQLPLFKIIVKFSKI